MKKQSAVSSKQLAVNEKKMKSVEIIQNELIKQEEKHGLDNDIAQHGSEELINAVEALTREQAPDWYQDDKWFMKIRKKYESNPIQRYAIAAALLYRVIDCKIYENGCELLNNAGLKTGAPREGK